MSTTALLQIQAAKPQPLSSSAHAGLLLQRKCACGSPTASLTGECAECKSKKRLQTKLTIGASNDPLEQEADRVADQVLAPPALSAVSDVPQRIQRFTEQASSGSDTAPASVDRVLASSGRPLEADLRQDMEQRFGLDFSRVRVYSGAAAEQSARTVNANAYTVGHNVVFGAGRFVPGTHEGRRLIAHELTHVVQQGGGSALPINPRSDADVVALPLTVAPPVLVKGVTAVGIARDPTPASEDPLSGTFSETSLTVATNRLPALTANELMERLVLAERGFQASPGGAPINTPKGKGSALGPGYKTYAGIQIIDTNGNQVISAIGQYPGGGKKHAEVNALRQLLATVQRLGIDLNGMRMIVVVDQKVCEGCKGALDKFAIDTGITKMKVYLASREGVTPKTAGRTAAKVGADAKLSFVETYPPKPVGMSAANSELPNVAAIKSQEAKKASAVPMRPSKEGITDPDIKPSPPPANAAPQDVANAVPKEPMAGQAPLSKPAEPPGVPAAKVPASAKSSLSQSSATKPPAPPVANNDTKSPGNTGRQRFSAPVGAISRPGDFADEANARAQAKGNAAILVVQGVLAILTYFADKHQRERADAAWAEVYPRIQEEITRTGRGVVVYVEYTQNTGSSVLIFEGIHWSSGGTDNGQPGALRGPGQTASFSRTYVGPTEAQAAVTDETALIFRRDEARTKQRELQGWAELMAKEGWLGRKLRDRAGDSINPLRAYDAKAHIVSASQSIKDKRYSDAAASLDKADAAMDEMWAQIKIYVGEKKLRELRGEN